MGPSNGSLLAAGRAAQQLPPPVILSEVIVRNADDHAVEEPALSEAEGTPTKPAPPNRVKALSRECSRADPCGADTLVRRF